MNATTTRRMKRTRRVCVAGVFVLLGIANGMRTSSQSGQTITSYQLVSQQPKPNGAALFTYRAALTNAGPALSTATATGTSTPSSGIALVDNTLTFGPVAAGGTVWSSDTFSFLGTKKSRPSDIVWAITATPNQRPIANAGPDLTTYVGQTAQLDASASSDSDGNPLTYRWTFVSRPAGSLAALSDPTAVKPFFTVDQFGQYVVQLIVNDGFTDSTADTVTITTLNSAPVANAGPDQTTFVTRTVTLNGSGSSDVDGNALRFAWSFVSRPAGSAAALANPTSVTPTFVVDAPGTYIVRLVVNDGLVDSAPDTVSITTANSPPVANAGPDQTVLVTDTVTLDGSKSTDVDGDAITYAWALLSIPAGSAAALSDASAVRPTFVVDRPGAYVAQLIVRDGTVSSQADTVTITTQNSAPVANAGPDQTMAVGGVVLLNGTGSSDVDGDPLTFKWSFTSVPSGSAAVLNGATTAGPSFVVDRPGMYVVQLIVNDGIVDSAPDTVAIATTNSAPTANAGPDQLAVFVGALVTLDGTRSNDPDGQPLTYSWSLIAKPPTSGATLAGPAQARPTFVPDAAGDYVAQLIVNDSLADSAPDTVLIRVSNPPVANAGPDQQVVAGATVQLDGSASSGNLVGYFWEFTSTPSGSTAALQNATTINPSFVADLPGAFIVQLTVTDNLGATATDAVVVTASVPAVGPVVTLNPADQTVAAGETATFAASADGYPAPTVQWQVSTNGTSFSDVPGASSPTLSFVTTPTDDGKRFRAVFSNATGSATTSAATLTVTVTTVAEPVTVHDAVTVNGAPMLDPLSNLTVDAESPVAFTAIARDPGDTFLFSLVGAPAGAGIGAGTGVFGWIPTEVQAPGTYSFFVRVTDTGGLFAERPITITVRPFVHVIEEHITVSDAVTNIPVITVTAVDPDASEAGAGTGTVRFTREGDASAGLTVNFTMGGTATNGVDYQLVGGTISFQPGETFTDLTVTPIDDQLTEGPETAVVTLIAGAGYVVGNLTTATVTIADHPPAITLALVNTSVVGVGLTAALRVTLASPAPAGGVVVTVTSDGTNILTVAAPGTTTIPEGGTAGQVTLNGIASGNATVRANAPNYSQATLDVTVTLNLISTPTTLNVPLGQTTQLPIVIGPGVAPPGGLVLDVVSANPSIVAVATPQVTVPAGALSINATVVGTDIGTAQVTVSNPNYVGSTTAVATRANINIVETSAAFAQGFTPPELTVRLESNGSPFAAPANLVVGLTSADPTCVTTPSSVTIVAGQVSATFQPQYGGVASLPCTATLTALVAGVAPDTVSVTVNPVPRITMPPAMTVGAGLQAVANATLGTAQHGGVTVTVASSDPSVMVSPDATTAGTSSFTLDLLNGQTNVRYYIQGLENTAGSSTVTVSAPGFTPGTQAVNVATLGVEIVALTATTTTQSANATNWYVQVGIPNADNTALMTLGQDVRAGGTPIVVTLTNSAPSVAQLMSDEPGATGQTVTKPIQPGSYYTQAIDPATNFGLSFDPVGAGTTTVTVTGPPGVATMTTTGVRTVVVTTVPGITTSAPTVIVGAGLQTAASATLGAAEHGGVTVTVASSDPRVMVSPDADTAGTSSFTLDLLDGHTSVPYYIQGLENTTGSATVTVSAPGFTTGTQTVTVKSLGVEIGGLPATTTTLSASTTNVFVQVGIPNATNTALATSGQNIRAGGTPIVVTLTNSAASVAQLMSDEPPTTGQTVTKPIQPGRYYTQATSPGTSFGLTFDPVGGGTTTVTVTGPPGIATMSTSGVRTVVVTTVPGITMSGPALTVGAGLQTPGSATLGATQHGGVTVTVASSDPSVMVSPNATTPGTSSFTLDLLNGQTSVPYYVQGLENTTGSATVTVSAPGFTSGTQTVTVKSLGVEIGGLPATTTTLSASTTNVFVQVGIPNATNTALATSGQTIRAGGTPIVVTLTNSTAAVARLMSDEPAATGQTVTKPIQTGHYYTQATSPGTSFGLTFDPVGGGTTTVTVTGPPGIATMSTSGVRTVFVDAPRITLSGTTFTVGAGLQVPTGATLGASQHGGVDVTVSSSAPELVLVSPNATTAGSGSIAVTLPNGATSVPFVLQGVENVDATAIVTVSAPGFVSATASVKVTPSAIEIQSLPASVDAALGEVGNIYVQVGIPNATNTGLLTAGQNVRAGSPGFVVTVTNSNPTAAELKSDEPAAIGQTVTKPIQSGQYYTHSIQSGTTFGLAFRPLAPGTTTVTATGPAGVITTNPGGNRQVSVTGVPTIVTIAATDSNAGEAGGNTGTFTITRSNVTAQALTVNYTRTGTATAGADYTTFSATSAIIPANEASVTVTVTPLPDLFVEGPETVTLTLVDAAAYDLGAPATQTATVTIADDPTIVSIAATDPDATEAGPTTGAFTISRIGGAIAQQLTVTYVRTGTATAGTDYITFSATTVTIPANQTSVTVTVTPVRDLLVESPETVTLTLVDAAAYDLGAPGTETATVTIADDPTVVSIVATDPDATEAGPTTGTFTISRIGGAITQSLAVTYVRTGTATAGTDYSTFSATTVTIPANQTSVTITVTPINDAIAEGPETVILTLTATANYSLGTQTAAAVTIVSDE